MYVYRGIKAEEPVSSNGFLCQFSELCIKGVLLDDVMNKPEHPVPEQVIIQLLCFICLFVFF